MKRLCLALSSAAALFWGAACSGGGSSVQPPPPTGKFSNASLNGKYAFMTSGEVFTSGSLTATPLSRVGSFTADGQGHITAVGVEDVNLDGAPTNAISIIGGSYSISADGRGTLTLNFAQSSIQFGITLTSTSDGLMIDETSTSTQASTGSGNFVKQDSTLFAVASVSGSYVFDFSGLDAAQVAAPISIVGQFAASNGPITSGVEDVNDNGLFTTAGTVSGNFATDGNNLSTMTDSGRGIAMINGSQYAFYIVNSTRVRFISISGGMLTGDAVAQATPPTTLTSGFAFVVAGSSGSGGVTRVGRFTANSTAVSNVLMDTNNAGQFIPTNSTSSANVQLDLANPGRGILTFTDPNQSVPFSFIFYLSSATQGVIQEVSQSATKGAVDVADGSIVAQSGSFSSSNISGTYALNWSGLSVQQGGSFAVQDEEDFLAQADITNLALSGTADIFQFTNGVPRVDFGLGGTITLGGDGTGSGEQRNSMVINLNGANPINFVVYFASPQLAFFANTSSSGPQRIVVGVLKAQQ